MTRQMTYQEITCLPFFQRFPMQTPLQLKLQHSSTASFSLRNWIGSLRTGSVSSALFEQGLAPSTQRTYKAAIKRFHDFCTRYCVFNPFPLSEQLLCHFATYLAKEGLAAQLIKIYLAAACNMHISLGFPDPRDSSSLPVLRRVQLGIQRVQASKSSTTRTRLPITLEILDRFRVLWEKTQHTERLLLLYVLQDFFVQVNSSHPL